ncbi:MAG: hypothetical protein ACK4SU_05940, partial [Dictyoglomus sp.]
GISFAFSNDTSGILLSTGINLFFHGIDPAELVVNPLLSQKPQYLSSGKLDVSALRTETPFFGSFRSSESANPNQTFNINTLYFRAYDDKGNLYKYPPLAFYEGTFTSATLLDSLVINFRDAQGNLVGTHDIPSGTAISNLPQLLDGSQGIKAYLENGILRLELRESFAPKGALWFEVIEGTSGINPLIEWNPTLNAYGISISSNDTLRIILNKLNRLPFFRAYLDEFSHIVMRLEPNQTKVYGFELGETLNQGGDPGNPSHSFLLYLRNQNMYIPAFRWDNISQYILHSGLEPIIKPSFYSGDSNIEPNAGTSYKINIFNINGNLISSESVNAAGTLNALISNFNNVSGIKAQILGDKFYIWLDPLEQNAPQGASYFTIEIKDDDSLFKGSLGLIRGSNAYIGLKAG